MNIKTSITITRCTNNKINIYIEDEASRIRFVELEIDRAEFANAITGLAAQECTAEVRGLEYVGMRKTTESRTAEYPGEGYEKRPDLEEWLRQNCQEEGWIIDTYLGSQNSVTRNDGKTFLNYRVYRYAQDDAK